MNNIQSFITAISFPTSLEELENYSYCFNVESLLGVCPEPNFPLNTNIWTVPNWCKKEDIIFFYHTKTAINNINFLKKELDLIKSKIPEEKYWYLSNCLNRAKSIYKIYGSTIFAVGKISDSPFFDKLNENIHFSSNVFANIDSIFILEEPISLKEFSSKIKLSCGGTITGVFGENFEFLKTLILKKNKHVRKFLLDAIAQPIPLNQITDDNWLSVLNEYRRSFFLEEQFRKFYLDRFLKIFGDKKTIYPECKCITSKKNNWVDNIVIFEGKPLMIEAKLNVFHEQDLHTQLKKYVKADKIYIGDKNVRNDVYKNMLVVDTENIYLYITKEDKILHIKSLDVFTTNQDIIDFRNEISHLL